MISVIYTHTDHFNVEVRDGSVIMEGHLTREQLEELREEIDRALGESE